MEPMSAEHKMAELAKPKFAFSPPLFESDAHYPTLLQDGVRRTIHHTRFNLYSHYFDIRCHRSETSLAVTRGRGSEPSDGQRYVPVLLQCVQVRLFPWHGDSQAHVCCRKDAWGHDNVTPIKQNYSDDRNGWGATIVDSLSTMVGEPFLLLLV